MFLVFLLSKNNNFLNLFFLLKSESIKKNKNYKFSNRFLFVKKERIKKKKRGNKLFIKT